MIGQLWLHNRWCHLSQNYDPLQHNTLASGCLWYYLLMKEPEWFDKRYSIKPSIQVLSKRKPGLKGGNGGRGWLANTNYLWNCLLYGVSYYITTVKIFSVSQKL